MPAVGPHLASGGLAKSKPAIPADGRTMRHLKSAPGFRCLCPLSFDSRLRCNGLSDKGGQRARQVRPKLAVPFRIFVGGARHAGYSHSHRGRIITRRDHSFLVSRAGEGSERCEFIFPAHALCERRGIYESRVSLCSFDHIRRARKYPSSEGYKRLVMSRSTSYYYKSI